MTTWPRRILGLARLARALRRPAPDVIISYGTGSSVACGLTWRYSKAKLWVWSQRDEGLIRVNSRLEKMAVSSCPLVVSNSRGGAEFLWKEFGIPHSSVHVIQNGVSLAEPMLDRSAWRRKLGIDHGCIVACMVGNVHRRKDHATLLRAWRMVVDRLQAEGRVARLLLAGRLDQDKPHRELCTTLGLDDRVRFLGPISDIVGLLGACDIGVHSSRSEGCPNAVLECMAAGLPVAGTDIPAIRAVVGADGIQFLASPGDAEGLAEAILKLARDRRLRREIGVANRTRAETEFSPRRMYEDTLSIITKSWPAGKKWL